MGSLRHRAIPFGLTVIQKTSNILLATILTGCVASSGSLQSFQIAEPRTNQGWILENDREPQLQQLATELKKKSLLRRHQDYSGLSSPLRIATAGRSGDTALGGQKPRFQCEELVSP